MARKLKIIIPTKQNKDQYINSSTNECLTSIIKDSTVQKDLDVNITVQPILENKTGLSELYQNILNESQDYDYVLFMHDDLEVHDHFLVKKLLKAHESFDIVGLAGATTQDYSKNVPMVWHLCREKPEHSRGIVGHYIPQGFNGVSETHINSAYFGPTPGPVVVIDGLFMSFKMSSLKGKGEIFNRNFTFHHYDMAMCVNASDMNLKVGVWPIYALHYGLGEFANDSTWQRHANEFKQLYGQKKLSL
jgi:glycosyltransferase involved in cell wall biosynthesis